MRKIIKFIATILILTLFINITISYAKNSSSSNKFFTVNKTEIAAKDTLEMTLDISKISYEEFDFVLNSNVSVKDISLNENVKNSVDSNDNEINIEINKSTINLNKITLYYDIPESMKAGDKITLVAQLLVVESNNNPTSKSTTSNKESSNKTETSSDKNIISQDTDNDTKSKNEETENTTTENVVEGTTTSSEKKVVQTLKVEVKVIDGKTEAKEDDKKEQKDKNGENSDKNNNSNKESKSNAKSSAGTSASVKSSTESSQVQTAVYNGSNNNYLSSIQIEGVELNTEFNKENQTYFAKTEGLSSINVTATKEDSNAKVYITGADSLKTGTNKILISVTAQNGDVRYYRIFIENK